MNLRAGAWFGGPGFFGAGKLLIGNFIRIY